MDHFNGIADLQGDFIFLFRLVGFDGDMEISCRDAEPVRDVKYGAMGKHIVQMAEREPAFVVRSSVFGLLRPIQRLQVRCRNPASFSLTLTEPPTWR